MRWTNQNVISMVEGNRKDVAFENLFKTSFRASTDKYISPLRTNFRFKVTN